MGSIKIAPSVLSADMANLKGELDKIAGADYVHFDVMDGHFTGNLTFGVDILKAVKRSTDVPVDAHLMVSNPDETVDWYADAGADMITVHYEAHTPAPHAHASAAARRQGRRGAQPRHARLRARKHHRRCRHGAADEREPWLWRPELYPGHAA